MEMSNWKGAAGICVNEENEVLLVLQGPPDEEKRWGVPSGPQEPGETLQESCERELFEVTGLTVRVAGEVKVKEDSFDNQDVSVALHYFRVEITGGEITVMEEDPWIKEIAWKPVEELKTLDLAYPEEAALIESLIKQ